MAQMIAADPQKWKFSPRLRLTVGGSAVPEAMIRAYAKLGIEVMQGWGMTETSPLATVSVPSPDVAELGFEQQLPYKLKQGRLVCNLDLKLVARRHLEETGVATVHDAGICTLCADPSLFFSHRRGGGVTGRQAGVVWRS